jgi:hypothetical protein
MLGQKQQELTMKKSIITQWSLGGVLSLGNNSLKRTTNPVKQGIIGAVALLMAAASQGQIVTSTSMSRKLLDLTAIATPGQAETGGLYNLFLRMKCRATARFGARKALIQVNPCHHYHALRGG